MSGLKHEKREVGAALAHLLAIVCELRERCPWDREQKLEDTARHLLEEAYEAADALGRGVAEKITDELGDLLVQALFSATVAAENGAPDIAATLEHAASKLVRRHPHIYGNEKAESVADVLATWERVKTEEKKQRRADSPLADVGRALPALMRAEKLGEKARQLGMDWADARDVLAKVREELGEAEDALARGDREHAVEEIGDMMLALANVPRFLERNAEMTLRQSCEKFIARFERVAQLAAERKLDLRQLAPAEVDSLWREAKRAKS